MKETWRNSDPEGCDITTVPHAPTVAVSTIAFYYEWE